VERASFRPLCARRQSFDSNMHLIEPLGFSDVNFSLVQALALLEKVLFGHLISILALSITKHNSGLHLHVGLN
jgi:hypothetical protein